MSLTENSVELLDIVSWNAISLNTTGNPYSQAKTMGNVPYSAIDGNTEVGDSITGSANNFSPFFYVEPTLDFLTIVRANGGKLLVEVTGSEVYDGIFTAVVETSADLPNPRPNFFSATGLYGVTLIDAKWTSFPPDGSLGQVSIYDGVMLPGQGFVKPNEAAIKEFTQEVIDTSDELISENKKKFKLKMTSGENPGSVNSNWKWIAIVAIILAMIAAIFLWYLVSRNEGFFCRD